MRATDVTSYLKTVTSLGLTGKIKTNSIDQGAVESVGVYTRGSAPKHVTVGGKGNASFAWLPVQILVHWGEDGDAAEAKARLIYDALEYYSGVMGTAQARVVDMIDPHPRDAGRDEKNICEFTIRLNIAYER